MKKIVMIGNDSSVKGGITTVINQFRDYDWKKKNIVFKFIPTYIESNYLFKIMFFLISIIRILFNFVFLKPDIVHIHMSYKGSFTRKNIVLQLAYFMKIKTVVHLHGSEFEKWYLLCNAKKQDKIKLFLRRCDKFIVLGNEWKKKVKAIEPATKIVVAPNTIKIPSKHCLYNDKKQILFLGVLIKRKGIYELINAIEKIVNDKSINQDNYLFVIAGTGEEENKLKDLVIQKKLDKAIIFTGWIDSNKKEELLLNSQCMILPSYNEGLPMAILEAMSYGLPIISTNVGDIASVVKNSYNGYIINPGIENEIYESLKKIILMSEKKWKQYSNNSKRIIKDSFSFENYIENFIQNIY